MSTISKHIISATIISNNGDYQRSLTFLTIPQIISCIPDQPIDRSLIPIPRNIKLADPDFHRPAPVDLLLCAGVALSLLNVGQINLSQPNGPELYLQKTRLGWIIGGSIPTFPISQKITCHSLKTLQFDLSRFWEVEEGPETIYLSESEKYCEDHFRLNTRRNKDGRYVVALPLNDNVFKLGDSKTQALKRFISLERRLQRDSILKDQYDSVMEEYLNLGHMSEVSDESNHGYYLPHHGVIKTSSATTKLRVVFDASAISSSGISLNDSLHIGPKLQEDLLYILLRFRIHNYVITGDIEKMYRQFLIRPEDRKSQRILWRDKTNQLKTFQLNTVTFGLSAAPYLAIRCLKQLSQDEGHRFPYASKILQRDFYVDDAITGATTIPEAIALRKELTNLLQSAGLNMRQWASNNEKILQGVPEKDINKNLHLGESSQLKTLGIIWDSRTDSITYVVKTTSLKSITKRSISSEIAKIYDPLGLLGPIIILAKIILQKIWIMKVDWDESLPMSIHSEWNCFYTQLPLLNNVVFHRNIISHSAIDIQLHGFCDASEKAYGACVYLRTTNKQGKIRNELLFGKSKVAPLKTQSIPRLELCAALLLSSMVNTTKKALHISINRTVLWSDSTIVLQWLSSSPHTLKTFVANRISEIQSKTNISDWRHVPTSENPADLISRGQLPEDFLRPSIWKNGPDWLREEENMWPISKITTSDILPELKSNICLHVKPPDTSILDRFSSWGRMQRVIAYCLRWKKNTNKNAYLTSNEIQDAHNVLIRFLQKLHFPNELHCINKNKSHEIKGKLQKLNPFVDQDGILRVGGRLKHSILHFDQKHPIILPKARTTALIINYFHHVHLHAGIQATLYAMRQRYWPIDGRSQVWQTLKNCVRCCKAKPPPTNYVMGDLPQHRVTESRPFTHVGIDYCGPFYIKERKHRNRSKIKVYVAVFICLSVKAVHLELVSDMSSESFIAALKRFIARRGFCASLHSDNGSNFVGANNQLRELRNLLQSDDHKEKIQTFLAERHIEWHFIPPLTPHFGGLWEAAVKSFKYHLKRVVGTELFTYENLNTLIIEIESILNSRPLTPISSDPNDPLVLTPSHFLIGESLTSLRDRDFRTVPENRLSIWEHIQKKKQHFWTRWHREYLNELTIRNKWNNGMHNIKEGTIVLVREDNVPSMQWPLAKIIKIHPGSDGIIRAVTIKTEKGEFDRSVKRLVPLPNQSEEATKDHVSRDGPSQHPATNV